MLNRAAVLSLMVGTLAACNASAQGTRPRGEIRGRVVNAATQAPIASARVEATGGATADSITRATSGTESPRGFPEARLG